MLTEEQLEYIPEVLRPLFQNLEHEVICDVAKRIQKTLAYTRTAELEAQALQKLGFSPSVIRSRAMKLLNADAEFRKQVAKNTLEHKNEVKKILREITNEAYSRNDLLFADMGDLSYLDDLRTWKSHGKELTDKSYLHDLVEGISRQTRGELTNITRTTGFKTMAGFESIQDTYRRELDKALIKVCTGIFSQESVIYDVIHELAHSGLRTIDYGTGKHMQIDTAVKLAVRTGAHQLSEQMTAANVERSGENLIYVSRHWGARNKGTGHVNHQEWQGKVYYIKPKKNYKEEAKRIGQDYIMDLWYATGYSMDGAHTNDPLGLNGYNCRHNTYVFFEGIDKITDTMKGEPEPQPIEIDGKQYDYYAITQKMRYMERSIRALKREREALTALNMDTKEVKAKIRNKTAEYEKFCEKCGMKAKLNRLRYDNGTSDIQKTEVYKEYREKVLRQNDSILRIPQIPSSIVSEKIKAGEYSTKLSRQQYAKHKQGTPQYEDYLKSRQKVGGNPQSILTVSEKEVQDIIENKAGSGIIRVDKNGNALPKEQITCDKVVGKYYFSGTYIETKKATIHYSKKNAHLVPERGENYD